MGVSESLAKRLCNILDIFLNSHAAKTDVVHVGECVTRDYISMDFEDIGDSSSHSWVRFVAIAANQGVHIVSAQ